MCCGIFGSLLLPAVDRVSASEVVLKDPLGQTSPEYSIVCVYLAARHMASHVIITITGLFPVFPANCKDLENSVLYTFL